MFLSPNNKEIIKRLFKYIILWITIVVAIKSIETKENGWKETIMISAIGACVFAILDIYFPAIAYNNKK